VYESERESGRERIAKKRLATGDASSCMRKDKTRDSHNDNERNERQLDSILLLIDNFVDDDSVWFVLSPRC
jgi:hypothetical protein